MRHTSQHSKDKKEKKSNRDVGEFWELFSRNKDMTNRARMRRIIILDDNTYNDFFDTQH